MKPPSQQSVHSEGVQWQKPDRSVYLIQAAEKQAIFTSLWDFDRLHIPLYHNSSKFSFYIPCQDWGESGGAAGAEGAIIPKGGEVFNKAVIYLCAVWVLPDYRQDL